MRRRVINMTAVVSSAERFASLLSRMEHQLALYRMSTMATRDRTFLEVGRNETDLIKNLLINVEEPVGKTPAAKTVKPEPGFCIKTKDEKGQKVFINICKSTELPPPKDISENKLISILESEDPSDYRVPMSLGEPHIVSDKGGKRSKAFDIVINSDFYEKTLSSELFQTFLITVSMDGLDEKFKIELNRNDWVILKNKKYFGEIVDVNIKQPPKPLITELNSIKSTKSPSTSDIRKTVTKETKEPEFTIRREKSSKDHPDSLLMEIQLPGVKCGVDIKLDIGGDRIILEAISSHKENYKWDAFLPVDMDPDHVEAKYDAIKQVLIVTVPTVVHKDYK